MRECCAGERAELPRSARDVLRGGAMSDVMGNDASIPGRARRAGKAREGAAEGWATAESFVTRLRC